MICESDAFILDLLNNRFNNNVEKDCCESILNDMIKHKIYLRYFDDILNYDIFKEKREMLKAIKSSILEKIKIKNELLKEVIKIFNNKKLEYIVYKGYVLNHLSYRNCDKREYNDIDIIIKNPKDLKTFIDELEKHFLIDNIGDKNFNSLNSEVQLFIFYKNNRIPIEFKKITKNQIVFNGDQDLMMVDTPIGFIKTFNYETTLLNLISYFSYYNMSAYSILTSKKLIFKYPVELYDFIVNNFDKINFKLLSDKILKNNMIKKTGDALFILSEIFNNFDYLEIFKNLKLKFICSSINNFIPTSHMYLHREEMANVIKKHLYSNFIFNYSENIKESNNDYQISDSKVIVKYTCKNKELFINFKYDIKHKWILYFQLYGSDKNNEFYNPFLPIFIHVTDNVLITESIYKRNMQHFRNDTEKRSNIFKYFLINKDENSIELSIDLSNKFNFNKKIGINYIVYCLGENNDVIELKEFLPFNLCPAIINRGNENV